MEPIDIQEVLKHLRETVGTMAQENAVLKAQIDALTKTTAGTEGEK